MQLFYNSRLKQIRQKLRSNPPEPEIRLWNAIRNRQCAGVKFRRQCSIGPYVVDFYSFEKRLVIEIDGDSHYNEAGKKSDLQRDSYLNGEGITIIRFTNEDIIKNLAGSFEFLEQYLLTGELRDK